MILNGRKIKSSYNMLNCIFHLPNGRLDLDCSKEDTVVLLSYCLIRFLMISFEILFFVMIFF